MRFGARELVLVVVLLAIPVASYFLVFQPQNEAIEVALKEIEHKERTLEKLKQETARTDDLARAIEQFEEKIADVEAQLPSDKGVDSIVRQVSDLAVEAGLASPALKSEDPVPAGLYFEQPLAMSTVGRWKDSGFYEFLLALERLPRKTRIPSMKLKRDSKNDGMFEIEFTLSIYFQDGDQS